MLQFLAALMLIVFMMLTHRALVRLVVDPDSSLWAAHRRRQETKQARHEVADLDREYASLIDEHRDLTR